MSRHSEHKSNHLLIGLLSISAVLHAVAFMSLPHLTATKTVDYITLEVQEPPEPAPRTIPSAPRPKTPPPPSPKLSQPAPPLPEPIAIPETPVLPPVPMATRPPEQVPEVAAPPQPAKPAVDAAPAALSQIAGPAVAAPAPRVLDTALRDKYLSLVRQRIAKHKRYPSFAERNRIEGRGTVRFVIKPDGEVASPEVTQAFPHRSLAQAALNAVRDAAPFPKPPADAFDGPISVELALVFELN